MRELDKYLIDTIKSCDIKNSNELIDVALKRLDFNLFIDDIIDGFNGFDYDTKANLSICLTDFNKMHILEMYINLIFSKFGVKLGDC